MSAKFPGDGEVGHIWSTEITFESPDMYLLLVNI